MSHQEDFQFAEVSDILNKMPLIGNIVSTHVVINILPQCNYMIYYGAKLGSNVLY